MKKLLLAGGLVLALTSNAAAEAEFIFDVKPGAILFSSDLDGFKISSYSSSYYSRYSYRTETIDGNGSWIPSVNYGVGVVTEPCDFDFTVGVGYLLNGAFDGSFIQAEAGAHFNLGAVKLGPHIGVIRFNEMDWSGSTSGVSFESTNGIKTGVDFTVGNKIYFLASLEYLIVDEAKVNVLGYNTWASSPYVDYSGLSISLGVAGRF